MFDRHRPAAGLAVAATGGHSPCLLSRGSQQTTADHGSPQETGQERFRGKTVIVTGASSGIGRGVAERFSHEGANVLICARHEDKLHQVAKQLPQNRTLAQAADVSKYAHVEALVAAAVKRFGGLAVIVNNARTGMTEEMLEDQDLVARFMERMPLGRPAEPADIAAVVSFLASDDARFVNGVNLPVDGGVMASNGQPKM